MRIEVVYERMRIFTTLTLFGLLTFPSFTFAVAPTQVSFSDIQQGAWYAPAAVRFASLGYFANPQPLTDIKLIDTPTFPTPNNHFLPSKPVIRSELFSVVVPFFGEFVGPPPSTPTFDDVATTHPAYKYFEGAAAIGWTRGKNECVGKHPCFAFPDAQLTRGEAAAFIVKASGIEPRGTGRVFTDNPEGTWYHNAIQTLVDNCILQGDDGKNTVRPLATLNRAELATILDRIADPSVSDTCQRKKHPASIVSVITATGSPTVILTASILLKQSSVANIQNYEMTSNESTLSSTKVIGATLIGPMTIQLTLNQPLQKNAFYQLTIKNVQTNRRIVLHDVVSLQE